MNQLNFELMAQETLALSNELDLTEKDFYLRDTSSEVVPSTPQIIPNSPGILYRIDIGGSTFCVRGVTTDDLKFSYEDLEGCDETLRKKLRLSAEDNLEDVKFFKTDSIHLAEVLEDQLLNKRFPIAEDVLCNLSDPGFSWWLDLGENYLEIFFTSHGIHREDHYMKLGPMGDSSIAGLRLAQAEKWMRQSISVNEYSISEKGFGLSCANSSQNNFKAIRALFESGDLLLMDEDFPSDHTGKTLFFYFKELAACRRLWIEIEKNLTISLA